MDSQAGGVVRQFVQDDKGCVGIGAFGVSGCVCVEFVVRARMGLLGGVRARIHTVSITVRCSLDAVVREKSSV